MRSIFFQQIWKIRKAYKLRHESSTQRMIENTREKGSNMSDSIKMKNKQTSVNEEKSNLRNRKQSNAENISTSQDIKTSDYVIDKTSEFDSEAMYYLSYILYPACILGAVYSLLYVPHKRFVEEIFSILVLLEATGSDAPESLSWPELLYKDLSRLTVHVS